MFGNLNGHLELKHRVRLDRDYLNQNSSGSISSMTNHLCLNYVEDYLTDHNRSVATCHRPELTRHINCRKTSASSYTNHHEYIHSQLLSQSSPARQIEFCLSLDHYTNETDREHNHLSKVQMEPARSSYNHARHCRCNACPSMIQIIFIIVAFLCVHQPAVTAARFPLNSLMQHQPGVPMSSFVVGSQSFNPAGSSSPSLCPDLCTCIWSNGKPSATCEKHNLATVPSGISPETQVLVLHHNNFQTLPSKIFFERGLVNLQKIFLSDCKITVIANDAFFQLTNLVELDLSHNSLAHVPKASFKGTPSLRRLSLASNPLTHIESEAFSNLQHLTSLDLSNCQLERLDPSAFFGMPNLKDLKLTENRLAVLPQSVIADLPPLLNLELSLNPWHCDCELRVVRDWMFTNNISFSIPPACASPYKVVDLLWTTISPEKLACPPVIVSKNTDLVVAAGTNVSLTCTIKASDPMKLFWFQDEKNLTSKSNQTGAKLTTSVLEERRYDMYEEHGPPGNPNVTTSVLVLFNLKPKDTSLFLCYVENEGGYTVANYSLTVLEQSENGLPFGYPSLWPIGSSIWSTLPVIGLFFIVLLFSCTVCFIVVKKQKHTKKTSDSSVKSTSSSPMKSSRGSLTSTDDNESTSSSSSSTRKPSQISTIGMDVIEHMRKGIISMDYHSMSPVIQFNNNYNNGTLRKECNMHTDHRQQQINSYNSSDLTNSTTTTGYNSDYTISDQPSPNSSYNLQPTPMVTIPAPTPNLHEHVPTATGPPYYQSRSNYIGQQAPPDLTLVERYMNNGNDVHLQSNPNFYHPSQPDPPIDYNRYMYTLSRPHQ